MAAPCLLQGGDLGRSHHNIAPAVWPSRWPPRGTPALPWTILGRFSSATPAAGPAGGSGSRGPHHRSGHNPARACAGHNCRWPSCPAQDEVLEGGIVRVGAMPVLPEDRHLGARAGGRDAPPVEEAKTVATVRQQPPFAPTSGRRSP
ncbi:hypothetical protein ZWY2020_005386 [Hordeum vulgare]|nr:hypothetical protein ZWY2020_005386 [Hordeum vulgare]